MEDNKGFGARIKTSREMLKYTMETAAELCEVSLSTWKQYERGERFPVLSNLKKICINLKVTPNYLFGSELDELMCEMDERERLKFKIDQLDSDDLAVADATVTKLLEIRR